MVAKSVKVIAQTDVVKYMLSFPMLRGRLGKWMLALTEFDLQYIPKRMLRVLGIIHHSPLRKYLSQRNKIDTITTQEFNVKTPITGEKTTAIAK